MILLLERSVYNLNLSPKNVWINIKNKSLEKVWQDWIIKMISRHICKFVVFIITASFLNLRKENKKLHFVKNTL